MFVYLFVCENLNFSLKIKAGHLEVVEILVKNGAIVDLQGEPNLYSALHSTCQEVTILFMYFILFIITHSKASKSIFFAN